MADLMTADDASVKSSAGTPVYGLFYNNVLVLKPDTFLSYSYSNDSRISQYPQEPSAFQTYNKVDTPYEVRVSVAKGGTVAEVSAFLEAAEKLPKASDLNLYTLITPERQYVSCNVQKVSHEHKRDHGANMATLELHLTEIRVTASAFYSNTASPTTTGNMSNAKSPTAADKKQVGTVQPQTPTPAQVDVISNALAPYGVYGGG